MAGHSVLGLEKTFTLMIARQDTSRLGGLLGSLCSRLETLLRLMRFRLLLAAALSYKGFHPSA